MKFIISDSCLLDYLGDSCSKAENTKTIIDNIMRFGIEETPMTNAIWSERCLTALGLALAI